MPAAQGSVDKGERWRSNGAKGTLTEQLQTMHQPLDTTQESGACSRLPQASTGNGASVMQLMSTMARKPHWQKGKLGECSHVRSTTSARLVVHQAVIHMAHEEVHACYKGLTQAWFACSIQDTDTRKPMHR